MRVLGLRVPHTLDERRSTPELASMKKWYRHALLVPYKHTQQTSFIAILQSRVLPFRFFFRGGGGGRTVSASFGRQTFGLRPDTFFLCSLDP